MAAEENPWPSQQLGKISGEFGLLALTHPRARARSSR
jgi:hypothetical protein